MAPEVAVGEAVDVLEVQTGDLLATASGVQRELADVGEVGIGLGDCGEFAVQAVQLLDGQRVGVFLLLSRHRVRGCLISY